MAKRGLTLENERARAENEYRQLLNLPGRSARRYLSLEASEELSSTTN